MNIPEVIRAIQKELGIGVDGYAGLETWQAIYNRIVPNAQPPAAISDKVDDRSEKVIATLLPEVQPYARALVTKAGADGITIKVISGLRSYDEQNDLYAQGRTKPGRIVTNARGGSRTTILGSHSTLVYSKAANISTNLQSIKLSVFSAWTWDWNGAATGNRFNKTADSVAAS